MHRTEIAAYAYQDFWSGKPKAVRWFYRLLSHLIVPLSVCVFNNAHTVGVYHDARLLSTFRESAQKLKEGDRLVIFPECYDEHNNIVHAFHDRFIDLGRMYYKQTGKALPFVPCAGADVARCRSYHAAREPVCQTSFPRLLQGAFHGLPQLDQVAFLGIDVMQARPFLI